MKKTILSAILTGTIIATTTVATVASAESLGIAAGQQGSQNYALNAGLSRYLTEEAGMDVRVQSYGGSGQTLPMIDAGRLDLQLVITPDVWAAAQGKEPFEARPLENLRVVAVHKSSTYSYGFMVRKDSSYHKVSDIKGLSITYGYTAQPTLRTQVDAVLAAGGLSIDDMQPHLVATAPNGVNDLISGNVDVAYNSLQSGKSKEADASVSIRWLALDQTPEAEAALQEVLPPVYINTIEPADGNVAIVEPTPMMSFDYYLVAGAHVPEETIYKIVKALHDNPEKVRGIYRTFAEFDPAEMALPAKGLSYHPGAVKFYNEAGLMD